MRNPLKIQRLKFGVDLLCVIDWGTGYLKFTGFFRHFKTFFRDTCLQAYKFDSCPSTIIISQAPQRSKPGQSLRLTFSPK